MGEIFDKSIFTEGGDKFNENVQTTLVPAGGSAIVEFKVEMWNVLILVDILFLEHSTKGALGMLKAEGEGNKNYLFRNNPRRYLSSERWWYPKKCQKNKHTVNSS